MMEHNRAQGITILKEPGMSKEAFVKKVHVCLMQYYGIQIRNNVVRG